MLGPCEGASRALTSRRCLRRRNAATQHSALQFKRQNATVREEGKFLPLPMLNGSGFGMAAFIPSQRVYTEHVQLVWTAKPIPIGILGSRQRLPLNGNKQRETTC